MSKKEEIREDVGNKLFNAFGNIKRSRELAGEIVQYLDSQGVVIKVDRESWWHRTQLYRTYEILRYGKTRAGSVAVEELI